TVSSLLPESSTTISSAQATDSRQAAMLCASLRVIRTTDRRGMPQHSSDGAWNNTAQIPSGGGLRRDHAQQRNRLDHAAASRPALPPRHAGLRAAHRQRAQGAGAAVGRPRRHRAQLPGAVVDPPGLPAGAARRAQPRRRHRPARPAGRPGGSTTAPGSCARCRRGRPTAAPAPCARWRCAARSPAWRGGSAGRDAAAWSRRFRCCAWSRRSPPPEGICAVLFHAPSLLCCGMPRLSVVLITRNEAHNIAACLESVAWADEIVGLDSGSSDEAVAICRRHGARVETRPDWPGFGPQKNRALDLAGGDWLLSLDADERVTPELRAEIEQVL